MSADDVVARAVAVLRAGGLVGLPTETVYGLAADAENPVAVQKIFAAKGRPADHPVIVHAGSFEDAQPYAAAFSAPAVALAQAFWPGPLTLIVRRSSRVPLLVTGGLDTVGLRVPRHPMALAILRAFGRAVAAPSANRFGAVSPTSAEHVRRDLGAAVDLVVDGGDSEVGLESTIVDLSGDAPAVLRAGAITTDQLTAVLGTPVPLRTEGGPRAPGTLPSHYAPRASVELVPDDTVTARLAALSARHSRVGFLGLRAPRAPVPPNVTAIIVGDEDPAALARTLYRSLRALDDAGCEVIVTTVPEERGLGVAIADRLRRAAAPR